MNVANNGDWRTDVDYIGLAHEDFLCLFAYLSE